jgi:NADH:ubiquinone oxidoreductase subunit F (NADH-binding)
MPDAPSATVTTARYQLLGHPTDLEGHLRALGPLLLPQGSDRDWGAWLLAALDTAGLTGRGGAAFPTAVKLGVARGGSGSGVLVVNAMEGEPASDKDKVLLTRVPHLVLDGAQAMAAASGADEIMVCVPAGRDGVAEAVRLAQSERAGRSEARIPELVVRPPDRFVAGEESALTQWIDSGSSRPLFRPDKRIPLRVGRRRALVHNAETLAHVGLIARLGAEPFRAHGMAEEPGTTLVTVTGAVARPGVVEIARGTSLRDVVARSSPTEPIDAMLVGGYGGAWVGPEHFGTPYASISLRTIGATAGVGVIVALAGSCGLGESARLAHYLAQQSSGQCGPCVFGLPALAADLALLAQGRVDADLMPRLARRLDEVEGAGACRHPDGAVGMVRSALRVFADDVAAHGRGAPCAQAHAPTRLRFPERPGNVRQP